MAKLGDVFCPECGSELPTFDREITFDFRWEPARGEIARRVRVDTKEQLVNGRVTVRYDQQAILLGDGEVVEVLDPGPHTFEATLRDRHAGGGGPKLYEFLLVDRSEIPLTYSFAHVRSKDGIPCRVDVRLVVEASGPERLLAECLKGVRTLSKNDLRLRLEAEVQNAVGEAAAAWDAKSIAGERSRKDELAGVALAHLKKTFEGFGLSLVRVETLHAHAAALDAVREADVARAVRHCEGEGEAAELEQDLQIHRRKAKAWGELRRSVYEARKGKYQDATDLIAFIRAQKRQIKEAELIEDREIDALAASVQFAKEDRERARAFLIRRIEEEQAFELERLEAKRRLAELADETEEARRSGDTERLRLALEAERQAHALDAQAREADLADRTKDREQARKHQDRASRVQAYVDMKNGKAEAAAIRLKAAQGLGAAEIAALFAHEEPLLAKALKRAFAGHPAEERVALELKHAQELREIHEAAKSQDAATIAVLIERLAGALSTATRERAEAGDREAATTLETLRIVSENVDGKRRKR